MSLYMYQHVQRQESSHSMQTPIRQGEKQTVTLQQQADVKPCLYGMGQDLTIRPRQPHVALHTHTLYLYIDHKYVLVYRPHAGCNYYMSTVAHYLMFIILHVHYVSCSLYTVYLIQTYSTLLSLNNSTMSCLTHIYTFRICWPNTNIWHSITLS